MDKRYQQKQTRGIPPSKTSLSKSFNVQRSSLQPKDAELSRSQNKQNPLKRTESAQAGSSNPKDIKSNSSKHSAFNSRQRQNSSAQLDWRQATRRHSSRSSLGGRSFNPSLRRKLAGGGDGEETSEQQTHNPSTEERVYSHEPSGNEAWTQSRQQDS